MKKTLLALFALGILSGCVGFVNGKSKTTGETIHDLYIIHPIISTKYIARM